MSRTRLNQRDFNFDEEEDKINDPSCTSYVRVHLGRNPKNSRNDQKELGKSLMAEMRDRSRSPIHRDRTPSPLFNSASVSNDFEDDLHDVEKKHEGQINENKEKFLGEESQPQQLIESSFINDSNNSEITNMEAQDFSQDTASTSGNHISDENELTDFQIDFNNLFNELFEDDEDALNEENQLPLPSHNLTSSDAKKKSTNPIFHYLPARILESDEVGKNGSKETCPICRDELKDLDMLRQLPCLHEFHAECVDDWIKKKKKCPLCRDELTNAELR